MFIEPAEVPAELAIDASRHDRADSDSTTLNTTDSVCRGEAMVRAIGCLRLQLGDCLSASITLSAAKVAPGP